jgi:NitT/TauT family transport system substrate-binding protein
MRSFSQPLVLLVLIGLFSSIAQAETKPTAVKMVLQWEHQSQFAGYYMALEKGFYDEENLAVTLVPGGADVHPLTLVQEGKAEFCSAMLSSALTQSDPQKLTLVQQIINRSNLTLVAWKTGREENCCIETPTDLEGKTITVWEDFRTPYQRFFIRQAIQPEIIPQYYSVSLFLARGSDACCAMRYNEYHLIQQLGISTDELTVFDLFNLGINLPEDGIYCRKEFYSDAPETCERFSRASMRGWQYAKDHPQETLDVVMRYIQEAKIPTNRPHMEWMLTTVLNSIFPENKTDWVPGKLSNTHYQSTLKLLEIEYRAPAFSAFVSEEATDEKD